MGQTHAIARAVLDVETESGRRLLKKKKKKRRRRRQKKTPRWGEYERRETRVREILRVLTGIDEWESTRKLPWLVSEKGARLELDCYSPTFVCDPSFPAGTAVECDGLQHRKHVAFYHKSRHDWEEQQARDLLKDALCRANGVKLIRCPPRERLCDSKLVLWLTERLF